jgi:hypothetical protein
MRTEEKREDESVTQFTMRRIRNEILEEAAVAIEETAKQCHWSFYAALYAGVIRGLKDRQLEGNHEMINLTQHPASPEQIAAGVVDGPREEIARLLTFDTLPTALDIHERAMALAELAERLNARSAMIGGAPFLMAPLEHRLQQRGIDPLYAFSRRVSVEEKQPDGSVRKVATFRHEGFVCCAMRARDS